jgi:hypothetical protein
VDGAVAGEQHVGVEASEDVERGQGAGPVVVEHAGQELRPSGAGEGVAGDQGVTGDDHPPVGQVVGAVAVGVPGGVHRHRAAGQVQGARPRERPGIGDRVPGGAAGP